MLPETVSRFVSFLYERKVLEIGMAFIISSQVNTLATTFNNTVMSPIIGYLLGGSKGSLTKLKVYIAPNNYIMLGDFLLAIINFSMIIFFVYLLVTQVDSLKSVIPPSSVAQSK